MSQPDNCLTFGEDIANLYDKTRPFRQHGNSPILRELCERLADTATGSSIRVIDVGCGTGRITIPLATHYEQLADARGDVPTLSIFCVEKSPHMLSRLQAKISSTHFRHVELDAATTRDIRDNLPEYGHFDAAIAHWVFHVISDWRVAVYAIDHLLTCSGRLFLLNEQSDLYKAIDGDYRDITDQSANDLWHSYHQERAKIARALSIGMPVLPPRFRVGSMVVDARVEQMFRALGWTLIEEFAANNSDCWHSSMRLDDIVNSIIRERAFTNMRMLPMEAIAREKYDQMASNLLSNLTDGEKMHEWDIRTTLTARVLSRSDPNPIRHASRDLMLYVLRDTLGRRWKRRKEHAYNRNALWRRLFAGTWNRLNVNTEGDGPCGALGRDVANVILGIYASAPFATMDDRATDTIACFRDKTLEVTIIDAWWELAGAIETHDPLCIRFAGRAPEHILEKSQANNHNTVGVFAHPHIHVVDISEREETLLGAVRLARLWDDCTTLRAGALRCVLDKVQQIGILPFHDRDAQTRFLVALRKIMSCKELYTIYMFPFRADLEREASSTWGLCICAKALMPVYAIEFLWAMSDVLFNEYLEDVLTDKEAHMRHEAAELRGPACAVVAPRTATSPEHWENATSPAILVVVSTRLELRTLIELSGVLKSIDSRRRRIGKSSVFRIELGFENLPVWAISTARQGGGTPGGSLSTVLNALAPLPYKPYAVIMPGICFGLQKEKQRLGDILVSERICLYEMEKKNPRGLTINRDVKPSATPELLRLLWSCEVDWSAETPSNHLPELHYGLMMSGEKLANDHEFVAELLDREPEAIGGEMEASGLYAGALEYSVRWIMMKGICDWGMGKGDKHQLLAARNSIDFLFHVLQSEALSEAVMAENPALLAK